MMERILYLEKLSSIPPIPNNKDKAHVPIGPAFPGAVDKSTSGFGRVGRVASRVLKL
jgi:hypothetical protein